MSWIEGCRTCHFVSLPSALSASRDRGYQLDRDWEVIHGSDPPSPGPSLHGRRRSHVLDQRPGGILLSLRAASVAYRPVVRAGAGVEAMRSLRAVSQRFPSLLAACEAFEHNEVTWSHDLYLRRMGDQMQLHRSVPDYRPTSMKTAKDAKLRQQPQPWIGSAQAPPCCEWPSPRSESPELAHPRRRRRSGLKVPAH